MSAAGYDQRWRGLALCLVAGFMTLLDVSIVNVALPSIQKSLAVGPSTIQWVVAGYALAFGAVLVPAGRLGDARSRRGVFAVGLALFTAASAACGAAQTPAWLAVTRVIQGIGAGIVSPQVSGFIQNLFRGKERGTAFGLFGATIGVSTAIGPLLGGVLVNIGGAANGWRYVFLINVPIGAVALLLVRRLLPASQPGRSQSLDPLGVLLFTGAMLLALLPLVTGNATSLASRPWWLLGPSAALLAAFWWWEHWWARRDRATLVDLALVRVRSYMLGLSLGTLYFAGFTSIFLVLTLYLQEGRGYDALLAGLTGTPFAIGSGLSAAIGGRVVHRFGRSQVVTGIVLVAIGLLAMDWVVGHVDHDIGLALLAPLAVTGIGSGLVISPNVTLSLEEVDVALAGSGGGMLQTAQRIGSAVGVALVLAQFFSVVASTHGDFGRAMSVGLRTTIAFVLAALVLGVVDLFGRGRPHRRGPRTDVAGRHKANSHRSVEQPAERAH